MHAMKNTINTFLVACLLAVCAGGCSSSSTSSEDVAYEDSYAGDYYYPADVGYAGLYGAGFGYGIYFATPAGTGFTAPIVADSTDGGAGATGAAGTNGAAGATGAAGAAGTNGAAGATGSAGHTGAAGSTGTGGAGGTGSPISGSTTVRGAVGEAIRNIALGGAVCPGQVTVTRPGGTDTCGLSGKGLNIVFNGCQLSAGGTVDGTVNVQFNLSASDSNCNSSTTISLGYTSTITNLVYTGTGGAKIAIPNQMDMATIHLPLGTAPTTVTIMSNGQIKRMAADGTTTSDRSFTGSRMFSAISILNQTYTVDGMINVTDTAGGTGTISGTGVQRERNCCKPTGGTLAVTRSGGSHSGSHSWTFTATCGSATLDGKTVTLPACL
jgi:hypothetical protein